MAHDVPGVIEPGNLYLADEVQRRLHLGAWAWRQLRHQGLPVIRTGERAFVLGDDLIAHLTKSKTGGTP